MAWPRFWPSRDKAELTRLRESEARYRLLASSTSDVIIQYDADGIIEYASPSVVTLGYRPDQMVGTSALEFLHPEDAPPFRERLRRLAAGEPLPDDSKIGYRVRTLDGRWLWVQGNPSPLTDDAGALRGVVTVVRDVTEQKALEDKVAEREALYRQLAETVSDVILQYDAEAIIEYVSPSIRRFGYAPGDLLGRSFAEILDPKDEGLARRLALLKAGEDLPTGAQNEFPLRRADGSWAWVEGNPTPLRDVDGRGARIVTILRDITDRRRLEAEVADSERKYRLLAEQSPDIIIRYDVDGRVEYVSPAIRRFGADPDRLVGRNVADLLAADEAERNTAWMADLAAGRPVPQGRNNIWRTPLAGGGWIDWEGATNPLVEDGVVVGAISVLRDVTERVALEAQLREREALYRELADNVGDAIVRTDTDGLIEFASPSIRFFGYRPEDMVGRYSREFIVPEDVTGETRRAILAGEAPPTGADNEFRILRPDGTTIWVQSNPSVIRDADGAPIGIVSSLRDVTERRALEDELRRKQAEAEAATVAKSEFLANMSHEIRTPLTAVVGFAELLAKVEDLPEQARSYVERIARSGGALSAIVNNVLDFSKVEAGQIELRPEPFEPGALIAEAAALVADEARRKGLLLRLEVDEAAPRLVMGDAGRLTQVLANLLTNAVKFTERGGVTVEATYEGERLRVAVRDSGVGVAADMTDLLFQRFSQIDGTNARRFGGAGLGLAISKGLVELMGGEIGFESVEGVGSTFWFAVPAEILEARAPAVAAAEPQGPGRRARVLVVDDAPLNRELIAALLDPFDVETVVAADGLEAVAVAGRERFDLVLMDLQMPGMDGIAATRAIRSGGGPNRDTPIIAVSASVQPADVEACHAAGMDDHVPKPISARDLLTKVAHWTTAGRSQAALAG